MSTHPQRQGRAPRWLAVVAVVVTALTVLTMPFVEPSEDAEAVAASNFQPGNIISDAKFYDGDAMTAAQVQSFLNAQQPGCRSGYTCLNAYRQATPAMSSDRYCSALSAQSSATAAQIIARVGAACGISQRVLIVLLQKEQSLVTSTGPSSYQYSSATGFACPDTAPCDSSYGGFFYQVYYAARQFEVYRLNPSSFNYRAGQNNTIYWHPNAACGTSTVYIQNQATAGLYNYTPYRPNAAALANLYGTGDSCSSYGNRNFWRMWSDWFGSPTGPTGPPFGRFDTIQATNGGATIRGWAIDPDSVDAVRVHVYVDGTAYGSYAADVTRSDVGRTYPAYGSEHGFQESLRLDAGRHTVCVYAINLAGSGGTVKLGCRDVTVTSATGMSGSPIGAVDRVTVDEDRVRIVGWAADRDTTASSRVHIYVDGVGVRSIAADLERGDLARTYPNLGTAHGFDTTLQLAAGEHTVCVYAIDLVAPGGTTRLACRTVTVTEGTGMQGPPIGELEQVTAVDDQVTVSGWAADPDTTQSIRVHVYVDGRGARSIAADGQRQDLTSDHPTLGTAHGFSTTLTLAAGTHTVCAYAIDLVGGDGSRRLGCESVTVRETGRSGPPFGHLDAVTVASGSVSVRGWAIDPDTMQSIRVHIYVDGVGRLSTLANVTRNDVARVYPVYGAAHGFQGTLAVAPGTHTVCAYGIDLAGSGGTTRLGCTTVTVP